ncbi:hypothetical protein [Mariniblastus fucicola]|uniref:DUF4292 domain-containing protein n=1 Tax=Mariniblastus fucicola TaxID=980251 RepID=A0A5B9PAN1_9BACT|nr:hypothetical protein [Mariniblastus fucicola]QEG20161.1 hypothetical protein MFFC18_00080 [Mariniblastus fucicola]
MISNRIYRGSHLRLFLGFIIAVAVSKVCCGTASAQLFRFGKKADPMPVVFNRKPTQAELLQHLNSINSKFKQLSSDLRISLDGTPKLRGTMQLELPRRLRIKAGVMGVSQFGVDVGSNNQDFWVWTKVNLPNQRPAIFHASHEGFRYAQSSVRQAIPLEPVWLLEGLGLLQFEPGDVHKGPDVTPEGYLKLFTIRRTPNGPNFRVTLIHAVNGTVLQQALYDSQENLIAYTDSKDYKSFPKQGVSLPEKIEMHLFQNGQEAKMVIEASDFQFDSLYGDPAQMWSMPQPKGVQAIDLTKIR